MLKKSEIDGRIRGINFRDGAPTLSNMFLADDIVILAKVDHREVFELLQILNLFSQVSGQRITTQKSVIIFGKGDPHSMRNEVSGIFFF